MDTLVGHSLDILEEAFREWDPIAVACSFGKDSIVVLDLARRINPDIQVFSIVTRYKPTVTLAFKEYVSSLWDLNLMTYQSVEALPDELYLTKPGKCCLLLKVIPTKDAIEELKLAAWITGLRVDEGETRHNFKEVEEYECGLVKINPILNWTEVDVWKYTALRGLPVNPLYGQGYRSLGCAPCSLPYTKTERGGRWKGTSKEGGECGIHTMMFTRME